MPGRGPASPRGCRCWAGARSAALQRLADRPGPGPARTVSRTRPATVFTIHNLAYQGLFDRATFDRLGLPAVSLEPVAAWNSTSSCPSSRAASSSPTGSTPSARPMREEISTPASAAGWMGCCARLGRRFSRHPQRHRLPGLEPGRRPPDPPALRQRQLQPQGGEQAGRCSASSACRATRAPSCFGYVGRLVEQKGVDLILGILPRPAARTPISSSSSRRPASGDWSRPCWPWPRAHPRQVGVSIGYDEDPRPPHRGRLRRLSDALALRALRAESALQPALRHAVPSSTAPAAWRTP